MKIILRWLLRVWFHFRWEGEDYLREKGPLVLAPNHVSWLDWLFLGVLLDADWKFVTSSTTATTSWVHRRIMVNSRTFPVDPTSAYGVREMADFLERGGKLVLFPEGRLSRTGGLMKVYDGISFLLQRSGARVITVYLRGANRTPWVSHPGWTQWRPQVSAHFAAPVPAPSFPQLSATVARQRVTAWLRDRMVAQQVEVELKTGPNTVTAAIGEIVRRVPARIALEDVSNTALTYRRFAVGADVLAQAWARRLAGPIGERVGVLLPNANPAPLTIASLWLAGKTPAMLNFSTGVTTMIVCAQLAQMKHIITARKFVEAAKIDVPALTTAGLQLHYLEDIRAEAGSGTKLSAAIRNRFFAGSRLRAARIKESDTAIVLFTSGSEGMPKGVELTHKNLIANARQLDAVMDITDEERFFSALPLFHSLGLVGGLLFPLLRGCYTFLYPSPLHYRIVPAVVYDKCCTVMLGTNTFLNGYARKANPYDFNTLKLLVAGAEKVQTATFDTWAKRFGVRILEGYGATECSPAICINSRINPKLGTAGRFLPGMEWKLEPVAGVTEGGRLWVRGPNVMKGYLNPEPQAKFAAQGGWYDTGDVVEIDDEGFVAIKGRMKRFAKISGEMVSLTAVEDALAGAYPLFGIRCQVAVVAVPDEDKGEKLIAVTNESRLTLADLRTTIKAKGLSNLSAPRELRVVTSIPKLGTGKTDHRALMQALAAASPASVAHTSS